MASFILAAIAVLTVQAETIDSDEIVVTAQSNRRCEIRLADQTMSDAAFDKRASEWVAGRFVRVVARYNADLDCVAKIAFRLAAKGVTRITYVDPLGRPAEPIRSRIVAGTDHVLDKRSLMDASEASGVEKRFFARRAAQLILDGKCSEAKKLVLEAGDLAAAAHVVTICAAR